MYPLNFAFTGYYILTQIGFISTYTYPHVPTHTHYAYLLTTNRTPYTPNAIPMRVKISLSRRCAVFSQEKCFIFTILIFCLFVATTSSLNTTYQPLNLNLSIDTPYLNAP